MRCECGFIVIGDFTIIKVHLFRPVYVLIVYYYSTCGSVSEKMSLRYIYIYISYKNHSRLNRYNFRTVHAIDFLFSTLHTTPFLYGKILFGVLHLLRVCIATSDTPQGMNPS